MGGTLKGVALSLALLALAPAAGAQTPPPVDLIHHLGLVVRVSSSVGNGRDLPAHLIDGDLATAWSSRTGELAGATVSVLVPDDAEVTAVALTAGLTRTVPRDLFRMNPRVARVAIARDGTVVREAALDVEDAGVQTIPVAGRGGLWTVRVAEVRAGARPAWREVSVSELRVMGRAGAPARRAPQVWIDGASLGSGREAVAIAGPFASVEAYCATRAVGPPEACNTPYGDPPDQSVCGCDLDPPPGGSPGGQSRLAAPVGPVRAARLVRVTRDVHDLDPCVLLLETARGTFALPELGSCGEPRIAHDYGITAHVDAMTVAALPDGGARLTVRVREREERADMSEAGGPAGATSTRRSTVTVRVGPAGDVVSALRDGRR